MTAMSAAALPPAQPIITAQDRAHPEFPKYAAYRSAMSAQLVEASSFQDWLRQCERDAHDQEWLEHPRYPEFKEWMWAARSGARRCPYGSFPENFKAWLEGKRW